MPLAFKVISNQIIYILKLDGECALVLLAADGEKVERTTQEI